MTFSERRVVGPGWQTRRSRNRDQALLDNAERSVTATLLAIGRPREGVSEQTSATAATVPESGSGPDTGAHSEVEKSAVADVGRYLPLVEQVVVQTAVIFPRYVDIGELVRAGVLGLLGATAQFDVSEGVAFERFAEQRIRAAVLDTVHAADWAPRSIRSVASRAEIANQELVDVLNPTTTDEFASLGVSTRELSSFRDHVFRSVVMALDQRASGEANVVTIGGATSDSSALEPAEELEQRELKDYLRDAVSLLPEHHRLVIVAYFLEDKTSSVIAEQMGVTEARVAQIRSEALVMLRDGIQAQFGEDKDGDPAEVLYMTDYPQRRKSLDDGIVRLLYDSTG